jgi:hypothetical protein
VSGVLVVLTVVGNQLFLVGSHAPSESTVQPDGSDIESQAVGIVELTHGL